MNPLADARCALRSATLAGEQITAEGAFPAELAVFTGHFPGQPLVPGVAIIALIQVACERAFSAPVRIVAVERCTWKAPTLPGQNLTLTIALAATKPSTDGALDENQERRIKATISHAARIACTAQVIITTVVSPVMSPL